ncbi:zonular occludens toxin domain-containing protein [Variovorax sp. EBFNA2]|uniref:zonular occludens toxin family protein n=1 Tax=Variovorax sp. EBFNA2 TaxID=3342097 RepID=UPI0029C0C021|nr:zonular occludens toxin domain-containing protein [Variovorax boronicumulans]WPG40576.1 zonular occludens toxin domain-containing protein [Variovorax boronicumulans]
MAILYYEGLPGAGKSYEAMATQIIPMLQKGREVVAYIEGLDHAKIAVAADLPEERVRELLFVITREDMRPREKKDGKKTVAVDGLWIEKVRDNAFHVFDEAQNWWPNRHRASEGLTQFVTEHRHRGIDILLMGQSLLDVLALWRRRVDQKFTFLKLTALGTDKRYRVTVFKGQGNDEFVKVADKLGKYDPKYFGTYKSHVSEDTNTETYTDNRAVFWKGATIKYGVPVMMVLFIAGCWKLWQFFHPEVTTPKAVAASTGPRPSPTNGTAPPSAQTAQVQAKVADANKSPQERYFEDLSGKYRIRLSGLLAGRGHVAGVVEWLDGNTRVVERQSLDTLRDLGVAVIVTGPTVRLRVGEWSALATMWPVEDAVGRVSEARQDAIRGGVDGRGGSMQTVSAPAGPSGLSIIDSPRREPAAPLERQSSENGFSQPRVKGNSPWSFQAK